MRAILIVSGLIRATVSVFFVPCCPFLLSFYLVLYYMFELNKWRCYLVFELLGGPHIVSAVADCAVLL